MSISLTCIIAHLIQVIDLCWAFYCCIESPVIGIVFHCKHNLIHSYTAISRKVVDKNVHATIPQGNLGYDQYTVLDTVSVKTSFVASLYHAKTYVHGLLCHSFKFLWRTANSKPPTIPFGIVACTSSDKLSRNSCIQSLNPTLKILKSKYLQILHKACLSPFLVANWPQRHNLFNENPLTPRPPWDFIWNRSRVQFKFHTPNAWGANSPPPGRLW